jgi:hypothetical protein
MLGAAKTMKLFRTAFWLGVVIYNLPSPASQPPAPDSQPSQGLAAKPASQLCPRPRESCPKNDEARPNRGDRGGHSSSRNAAMPSHDTLTPTDRAEPWRGPDLRNPSPATRTAGFFRIAGGKLNRPVDSEVTEGTRFPFVALNLDSISHARMSKIVWQRLA